MQLVGVELSGDHYSFDFSLLRRWIGLCEKNGILYLEVSHLFSQWGAECAPEIIVNVEGTKIKLFGWNTPAVSEKYTVFLHTFLPALKQFLYECGWLERTWFHISDEPHEYEAESFAAARASVLDVLKDCRVIDALSSYTIYQKGLIDRPVVSVDRIDTFIKAKAPPPMGLLLHSAGAGGAKPFYRHAKQPK